MEGTKKVVVAVVLALIIVGAIILIVKTARGSRTVKLPPQIRDKQVERMDEKTFQIVSRSLGEWNKIERKNGRYMNPETGEFNMVEIVTCQACGERVPAPFSFPFSGSLQGIMAAHICPKCGERVITPYGGPPSSPSDLETM